ncbi:hypothetical protein C7H19_20595 [Aphanothece hegewaldii CCALA 016]|uniref:Calcium-binding protein n=1 Tax=Aphanothece hegewaldii CCALA 016 TaxID=2107694 RepID=A0A2T1LSR4_9CHRO|nr:calcium-binding protein [Aphanothece hegewaldii]PSF33095.1 hypothetical protein C7H19_20595 [Aphanothece hegewaldii CCALA 016]
MPTFTGDNSNNLLTGTNGNDTFDSKLGIDTVDGGLGSDLLIIDYSSNTYTGTSPDSGISTTISSNGAGGFNGSYRAYYNSSYNYDRVSFSNIERFRITGTIGNDNIITGSGDDTINGGAGNDTIDGGAGINIINGGNGIDILVNANLSSLNIAQSYTDTGTIPTITLADGTTISNIEYFTNLTTGNGNDTISYTQRLYNTVNTGSGSDTINAGLGIDTVDGGLGSDLLIIDYSSNTYTGTSPDSGISSIISSNGAGGFNGSYRAYYNSSYNYDRVSFYNIERFRITGTAANDNIITGDGNDTINGGLGNDTIDGGAGINIINGGSGIDTLVNANFSSLNIAQSYTDTGTIPTITLADGTTISNIEYFTNLTTGNGNDTISYTQRLYNTVNTGSGKDTINAGLGIDTVDGGLGSDLLIIDYSSNTYTGTSPDSGISSIISSNGAGGFNGSYRAYYNSSYNYDRVSFYNIERFRITGTAANDNIITGAGNDTINGGAGFDRIYAAGGNDRLTGGSGEDTFVYNSPSEGIDTITDFNVNNDTIVLSTSGFGGGLVSNTTLAVNQFTIGSAATTAAHRLIYNSVTGDLFFDVDGKGNIAATQLANLSANLALTNADFNII